MLPKMDTGEKTMRENSGANFPCVKAKKPKEESLSEIVQQSRADDSCRSGLVNLRSLLVQRTMARYGFTEEQALAVILAFGGS